MPWIPLEMQITEQPVTQTGTVAENLVPPFPLIYQMEGR